MSAAAHGHRLDVVGVPPPPHASGHGGAGLLWCLLVVALVLGSFLAVALLAWRANRRAVRRCPVCAASAVRTLAADAAESLCTWVSVECGQCGTWRRLATSAGHARRSIRAVARDRAAISAQIEQMVLERRREDIDALTRALRSRIVGAEDFLALTRRPQRMGG